MQCLQYYRQFPNKFTDVPTTNLANNISTTKTTPNNTGVAKIERHMYFDRNESRYGSVQFSAAAASGTVADGGTFEYNALGFTYYAPPSPVPQHSGYLLLEEGFDVIDNVNIGLTTPGGWDEVVSPNNGWGGGGTAPPPTVTIDITAPDGCMHTRDGLNWGN